MSNPTPRPSLMGRLVRMAGWPKGDSGRRRAGRPEPAKAARAGAWVGFEALEARQLLATIVWDGNLDGDGGDNVNWDNPLNWATNSVPGEDDSVLIANGGFQDYVFVDSDQHVVHIDSTRSIAVVNGATLRAEAGANMQAARLELDTGRIDGTTPDGVSSNWNLALFRTTHSFNAATNAIITAPAGWIVNSESSLTLSGGGAFGFVENYGNLTIRDNWMLNGLDGSILNGSGASLTNYGNFVAGAGGFTNDGVLNLVGGVVDLINDFVNNNTVVLGDGVTWNVSAGAFDGTLRLDSPTAVISGNGDLSITGTLILNQGSIIPGVQSRLIIEAGAQLSRLPGSPFFFEVERQVINKGSILLSSGTLQMTQGLAADPGSVLEILPDATLITAGGTVTLPGGTTITVDGTWDLQAGSATIGGSVSVPGALFIGGSMTVDDTGSVSSTGTVATASGSVLTIAGTMNVLSGELSIGGAAGVGGALFVGGGLRVLTGAELVQTGAVVGYAGSVVTIGGTYDNQAGVLTIQGSLVVPGGGVLTIGSSASSTGVITADGSIDTNDGSTFYIGGSYDQGSGGLTVGGEVTIAGVFTSAGVVVVDPSGDLVVAGVATASNGMDVRGRVDVRPGASVSAGGTVSVNGGSIHVGGTYSQEGGTIDLPNGSSIDVPGVMDLSDVDVDVWGELFLNGVAYLNGVGQFALNTAASIAAGAEMYIRDGFHLRLNAALSVYGTLDVEGPAVTVSGPGPLDVIGLCRTASGNMRELSNLLVEEGGWFMNFGYNLLPLYLPANVLNWGSVIFEECWAVTQSIHNANEEAIIQFRAGAQGGVNQLWSADPDTAIVLNGIIDVASDATLLVNDVLQVAPGAYLTVGTAAFFTCYALCSLTALVAVTYGGGAMVFEAGMVGHTVLNLVDDAILAIEGNSQFDGPISSGPGSTITLGGGRFSLGGSLDLNGTLDIAADVTGVDFNGPVSGSGDIVSQAAVSFNDTVHALPGANFAFNAGAEFHGQLTVDASAAIEFLGDVGSAIVYSATSIAGTIYSTILLNFIGPVTQVAGSIGGADVRFTGGFNWYEGTLTGPRLVLPTGAVMNILTDRPKGLFCNYFDIDGDTNWEGSGIISTGGRAPYVHNRGAMAITQPGTRGLESGFFSNFGTVDVGAGSFAFYNAVSTGDYVLRNGATLDLRIVNDFTPTSSITGDGHVGMDISGDVGRFDGNLAIDGNLGIRSSAAPVGVVRFYGSVAAGSVSIADGTAGNFPSEVKFLGLFTSIDAGVDIAGHVVVCFGTEGVLDTFVTIGGDLTIRSLPNGSPTVCAYSDVGVDGVAQFLGGDTTFYGGFTTEGTPVFAGGNVRFTRSAEFPGTVVFAGGDVVFDGSLTVEGADFAGANVTIAGTFTAQHATFSGGSTTFCGTYSGPTGLLRVTGGSVTLCQDTITFGTVELIAGSIAGNPAPVAAPSTIHVLNSMTWQGGTVSNFALRIDPAAPFLASGSDKLMTFSHAFSAIATFGTLDWEGGDIRLENGAGLSGSTINKTGSGNLPVSGAALHVVEVNLFNHDWNGGTLVDARLTPATAHVVRGALSLNDPSGVYSGNILLRGNWIVENGATLNLSGATVRTNNAVVTLNGPAAAMPSLFGLTTNNGLLELLGGQAFVFAPLGNTFLNTSVINLGGNIVRAPGFTLNNPGLINLDGGALHMPGGTSTGTLHADAGTTVELRTHTLGGGAVLRGDGAIYFARVNDLAASYTLIAGTVTLAGTNMWIESTPTSWQEDGLRFANDAAVANLTGTLTWTGGELRGAGTLRVMDGGQLRLTASPYGYLHMAVGDVGGDNDLDIQIDGGGQMHFLSGTLAGGGLSILNNGLFNAESDSDLSITVNNSDRPMGIANNNLLRKAGAGSLTTDGFYPVFWIGTTAGGRIEVEEGTLHLPWGTMAGVLDVAAGATAELRRQALSDGARVEGDGAIYFARVADLGLTHTMITGTVTLAGSNMWLDATPATSQDGIGFANDAAVANLTGTLTWTGGEFRGAGTLRVMSGGRFKLTASPHEIPHAIVGSHGDETDVDFLIDAGGEMHLLSSSITGAHLSIINNGLFRVESDGTQSIAVINGGLPRPFTNNGTLVKAGAGLFNLNGLDYLFSFPGRTEVRGGTLTLPAIPQVSGATLTGGSWIVSGPGTLNLVGASIGTIGAGATVELRGPNSTFAAITGLTSNLGIFRLRNGRDFTTAGAFTNSGTLDLGTNDLTVMDAFIQAASGTLQVDISGTGAGEYGRLIATGTATLGGALRARNDGFIPESGDEFRILQAASVGGAFANAYFNDYEIVYDPTGVTLFFERDSDLLPIIPGGGGNGEAEEAG